MWTGIELLQPIQDIRTGYPFLEDISLVFSSRLFYLVLPIAIVLIFYWTVDKKKGGFLGLSCLSAFTFTTLCKTWIVQPRPWELDPDLIRVEGAHSNGYSLPSGHTAMSVSTYLPTAMMIRRRIVSILLIALTILIVASRLILCVHTPLDIIAGVCVGAISIVAAWKATEFSERSRGSFHLVMFLYAAAFAVFSVISIMAGEDLYELAQSMGFFYGMVLGRILEYHYVSYTIRDFEIKRKSLIIIKGLLIGAVLLGIPMLLSKDFGTPIGGFLMMIWSFYLYPKLMMSHRDE